MRTHIYLLFLVLTTFRCLAFGKDDDILISRDGNDLTISGKTDGKMLFVYFRPSINKNISYYSEVSRKDPLYDTHESRSDRPWEIIYPIVDLKSKSKKNKVHGVLVFNGPQSTEYSVNGMFFHEKRFFKGDSLFIGSDHLFQWENSVYMDRLRGKATEFFLVDTIAPKNNGDILEKYSFLTPQWQGQVLVAAPTKEILARKDIGKTANVKKTGLDAVFDPSLSRPRLLRSLKGSIDFTIRSQNRSENDPTQGGMNLFYDFRAKTFRRPSWLWSWGPSIKMVLESAKIPEIVFQVPKDSLQRLALQIGEASLRFQNLDKESPAYGLATSRWSETKNMGELPHDFEQFYSVADGMFLAGWGWMYLYSHLGDKRFLEATHIQAEATKRLLEELQYIPMDYMHNSARWKGSMISEQGFGVEGINELYRFAPEEGLKTLGSKYIDMLLSKLEHPSGGWNRAYTIAKNEQKDPLYYVRGHGWAMEGLTAAYELTQDPNYLKKAKKMAGLLMEHQMSDGSWSVVFTGQNPNEPSDKGTALWSLLFYRMYGFTGEKAYLRTARKALKWCLNQQYFGEDIMAHGSIPNTSRSSGVIYRKWFPMACNYTTAFFGLAIMEELKHLDESTE